MNAATNSYLGDPAIKQKYVSRMEAHIAADDLVQGVTWENGKGCFIGCTLEKYDHLEFEKEIGPEWLARLCDQIFEGLTKKASRDFAKNILKAIPEGKDLTLVRWRFCAFVLQRNIDRVLLLKNITEELKTQVVDAIRLECRECRLERRECRRECRI